MAIPIQCPECHKKYQAPDHMAGRRVKCKYCAVVFLVNADTKAAGPDFDLSELDVLSGEGTAVGAKGKGAKGGGGAAGAAAAAGETDIDSLFQCEYPAEGAPRTNKLYIFPMSRLLDRWLPPVLLAVGLLWVVREAFERNETQRTWVGVFRAGVFLLAFFASVFPFTLMGMRNAACKLNYELPPKPGLRVMGVYAVPFAFAVAMWLILGGVSGLLIGLLIGAVVALPLVFLLFRLVPKEAPVTFGYATGTFVLSVGVAVAAVFALNLILVGSLRALRTEHTLAGSPFGPEFGWDSPAADARKPIVQNTGPGSATTQASDDEDDKPTTTPSTGPTTALVGSDVDPDGPTTRTAVATGDDDAGPSVPSERDVVRPGTNPGTAPADATATGKAPKPPVDAAPDRVVGAQAAGGIVSAVRTVIAGPFSALIHPAVPGPRLAVVREGRIGHDRVEIWNTQTWKPAADLEIPRVPGGNRYAISPDGEYLCYATEFPKLAIHVWSSSAGRLLRQLDLDVQDGDHEIVGFSGPDQLVVRRQKGAVTALQVFNPKAGGRPRSFEISSAEIGPGFHAISHAGDAIAFVVRRGAGADLESYSLASGRPIKQLPIVEVNLSENVSVAGLSYTPDGSRIVAVFSDGQGAGVFVAWPAAGRGGRAVVQHFLPVGVKPPLGHGAAGDAFTGRSFHWLDKGSAWILRGSSAFDTETGYLLGTLTLPNIHGQSTDPASNTARFVRTDEFGAIVVDEVVLDLAGARKKAIPAREPAPPARGRGQ